jgi:hypothetical protein
MTLTAPGSAGATAIDTAAQASQLSQIVVIRGNPPEDELAALIAVLMARRAAGGDGDSNDAEYGLEPARWRAPGYTAANSWRA